jgi:GT2 family glycosyltransferase
MTQGVGSSAPGVSAVVVNWNGVSDLRVSIPSLLAQTYPHLEVLIVDNGSNDNSMEVAQEMGVRWIPLGQNHGLSGALNHGAAVSEGEFLLFLNNDMRFAPDFVAQLVGVLSSAPGLFGVDAMQFDWEGKQIVHSRTTLRKARWPSGEIPGWEFAQSPAREPTPCLMGSAANLLVRRAMFEELGGWDVDYRVGWEDVDLSWRAWMRGWGICYVPTAICWHRVGASTSTTAGARARMRGSLSGRLRFSTQFLPWRHIIGAWGLSYAGVLKAVVGGRYSDAVVRATVVAECTARIPSNLRQRRHMFHETNTTPGRHWRETVKREGAMKRTESIE